MQREQNNNSTDRNSLNTGQVFNRTEEETASMSNDLDGILDTPVSRVDGETPFGNVSDSYIAPGGEDGDEDYDDEEDDDDLDDDDIDEVAVDTEDVADTDPDVEDLDDDDLLLDDDDEDEDDEDDTL